MTTPVERLRLLYEVNRRLTTFVDLDELMRYSTRRTCELFGADGCALLFLDREKREFYFPVASQGATQQASQECLAEIRFPADQGIAGWVHSHDQAALVPDVASDPRFYKGVDRATHMTTRAILCAPLRSRSGNIGVIEVVNPAASALTADDLEFLEALAGDIAVAHEKAMLHEQLRGEVTGLRQAVRAAGMGLVALGCLLALGAVIGHMAWALPLSELPTRPGIVGGAVSAVLGVALIGLGSGWLIPTTTGLRS
ncbi:MAG TPA: GAF domain-containing protein [Candidatus Margulisiibacteriota bacterium]|nr:GAF domain-containing protein [Candidatus Margulisiibacteriota bacterium]